MHRRITTTLAAGFLMTLAGTAFADAPKVGDTAKDFTLKTSDGKSVTLSELTKGGPVALLVLRGWPGYQCPICTKQVKELAENDRDITEANAKVLMVYPGPGAKLDDHAAEFLANKELPDNFMLVTDPDFVFTKLYDLRWDAPKETAYPSTFVINGAGKITYAKTSKTHGDRAPTKDVLKAIADAK